VIEDRAFEGMKLNRIKNTSDQNENCTVLGDLKDDQPSYEEILTSLTLQIGEENIEKLSDLSNLQHNKKENRCLVINKTLSKIDRTSIHKAIKFLFQNLASETVINSNTSTTFNNQTSFLVYKSDATSLSVSNSTNNTKNKSKIVTRRWDKSKPDYHHFSVIKTDFTTNEVIENIAKQLHVLPTRITCCGNKDKKAITMQRFSGWRIDSDLLKNLSSSRFIVRDIDTSDEDLKLGNLLTNAA
jgi:hypothetical protein